MFNKEGIHLSVHALSRLPRLNKKGFPEISEDNLLALLKMKPNYSEDQTKNIFFDADKQLMAVKDKSTGILLALFEGRTVRRNGKMFKKIMDYIKDFLDNTPKDIYEFSIVLEDALVDDYDEMHKEQPKATEVLADEVPDICASAEPGMKSEEIEEFKKKLRKEYERALEYVA